MDLTADELSDVDDYYRQVSSLRPGSPLSLEESLSVEENVRHRKRRRSDDSVSYIDSTMDQPTLDESNEIRHFAKRSCNPIAQIARNVSRQLETQMELDNAVVTFVAKLIFAIFRKPGPGVKTRLLDTFQIFDEYTITQSCQQFTEHQLTFFPIYQEEDHHWALGVSEIKDNTIYFDFYGAKDEEANMRFERWINAQDFEYETVVQTQDFPEKPNSIDCGIYMLMHFRRILTGEMTSGPMEPTVARDELLDIIIDANIEHLKELSSMDASIVRRIKMDQCGLDHGVIKLDVVIPSTPSEDGISQDFISHVKNAISQGTREQLADKLKCDKETICEINEKLNIARFEKSIAKAEQKETENNHNDLELYMREYQLDHHRAEFSAGQEQLSDSADALMAELRAVLTAEATSGCIKIISRAGREKGKTKARTVARYRRQIKALSAMKKETTKGIEDLQSRIRLKEAHDEFESGALGI